MGRLASWLTLLLPFVYEFRIILHRLRSHQHQLNTVSSIQYQREFLCELE